MKTSPSLIASSTDPGDSDPGLPPCLQSTTGKLFLCLLALWDTPFKTASGDRHHASLGLRLWLHRHNHWVRLGVVDGVEVSLEPRIWWHHTIQRRSTTDSIVLVLLQVCNRLGGKLPVDSCRTCMPNVPIPPDHVVVGPTNTWGILGRGVGRNWARIGGVGWRGVFVRGPSRVIIWPGRQRCTPWNLVSTVIVGTCRRGIVSRCG